MLSALLILVYTSFCGFCFFFLLELVSLASSETVLQSLFHQICLPVVACFMGLVFSFLMVHKIMEHPVPGSLLDSGNVVFTIQLMTGSIISSIL